MKPSNTIFVSTKYIEEKEQQLSDLSKKVESLQEQLNEANEIIISVAVMPRFPVNPELCREYLEKWGAK